MLNTNCGVGPTLHHCTQPSISNIRFYDIGGRNARAPKLAEPVQRRHARVLPLAGPEGPRPRADLRRQRGLDLRHPRRCAQLPVLGLGHLRRAGRRGAGDAVHRPARLHAGAADRRAGREADGRPALADGHQQRAARVLRAVDRRLRDHRHVGLRGGQGAAPAEADHRQRGAAHVAGPGRAQRHQAVEPRLGVGVRRGVRDRHGARPRLPVGLGADGRHLRPAQADREVRVPRARERSGHLHRPGTRRTRRTRPTTRR